MQKIGIRLVLFLILSSQLIIGNALAQDLFIRVSILPRESSIRLKIKGFYDIRDAHNQQVLYRGKSLNTTVAPYLKGILIGAIDARVSKILIKAHDPIFINGRLFRGDIQIIKRPDSALSVVNNIELEDYIKGILYNEVSHYWPYEVLRAQAVVARTYAVYQMQENKSRDFDVTSDIYSQVYGGSSSERFRTGKAVKYTQGIILVYRNRAIPAYYHSCCGGHTEDAALLWNTDMAPLKGVVCNFCQESPHFNWHLALNQKELAEKLSAAGYSLSQLKEIKIEGKDNSGRITNLILVSSDKEIKISAKDFRNILGPNLLRSTNFTATVANDDIVFAGVGWGHGAGMCQWGAYFMAKQGSTYEQILSFYYPGAQISSINNN